MRPDIIDHCARAVTQTRYCIDRIQWMYPNITLKYPEINFKLKGEFAGRAYGERWLIKYNYLLLKLNFQDFIDNTIPHEVAHLVEYAMYGKTGHKETWKNIMKDLGVKEITRCHTYKTYPCRKRKDLQRCGVSV